MMGRIPPESWVGLKRNQGSDNSGMMGRLEPEYPPLAGSAESQGKLESLDRINDDANKRQTDEQLRRQEEAESYERRRIQQSAEIERYRDRYSDSAWKHLHDLEKEGYNIYTIHMYVLRMMEIQLRRKASKWDVDDAVAAVGMSDRIYR